MVDIVQDASAWTVVVNKRRGRYPVRPRHESSCSTPSAEKKEVKTGVMKVRMLETEQDEDLILRRLKRSMERLQKSEFFERFLQQLQRPCVLDSLYRSAAITECFIGNLGKTARSDVTEQDEAIKKSSSNDVVNSKQTEKETSSETCYSEQAEENVSSKGCYKERPEDDPLSEGCTRKEGFIYHDDHCPSSKESLEGQYVISSDGRHFQPRNVICKDANKDCGLQVITYGLGSIAESEVSRFQFALILLLKQRFSWVQDIEIYDPVLSQAERNAIEAMGCRIIDSNEEGHRTICRPTIFYMPHCEDWLYDNVLQANWMPHKLKQLVVLGNSFQNYHEAWSCFHGLRSKSPPTYILNFHQSSKEIPLEATSSLGFPAFNNMSWHFYQQHDLPCHPPDWQVVS